MVISKPTTKEKGAHEEPQRDFKKNKYMVWLSPYLSLIVIKCAD